MRILRNLDRDFPEWHGGCRRAVVWALDVDTPEVRRRVGEAAERLGGLLLDRYARQPHVTLAYAGLLHEPGANPADTVYDDALLQRDLAALAEAGVRPFRVAISGWGTFPMAPYLEASAAGITRLAAVLPAPADHPHVTVGLYCVDSTSGEVDRRMSGFSRAVIEVPVDAVHLMSYDTSDIAGPLRIEGTLSLDDGTWRWASH